MRAGRSWRVLTVQRTRVLQRCPETAPEKSDEATIEPSFELDTLMRLNSKDMCVLANQLTIVLMIQESYYR